MTPAYTLGLLFILLVALIWTGASILVTHLYRDLDFNSPYILTYICTSLFVTLLPNRLLWEYAQILWQIILTRCCPYEEIGKKVIVIPFRSGSPPLCNDYVEVDLATIEAVEDSSKLDQSMEAGGIEERGLQSGEVQSGEVPLWSYHEVDDILRGDRPMNQHGVLDSNPGSNSVSKSDINQQDFILGHYETFQISLRIAPLWFFANYFYNVSLNYTSITSSTILASTGSMFTFIFAVLSGDERFTKAKFVGVLICMVGSIITGFGDAEVDKNENSTNSGKLTFVGDLLGLLAAIGYGLYTVLIRVLCPKNENQISMQLLFGYVGLLNMLVLSPVTMILLARSEDLLGLTWVIFGWLVVKGMIDNVLSDYLWARSIMLTSATVATLGIGLTIPMAFVADWVMTDQGPTLYSIAGASAVLIGFILVNAEDVFS